MMRELIFTLDVFNDLGCLFDKGFCNVKLLDLDVRVDFEVAI